MGVEKPKVVDEVCYCTALKSEHEARYQPGHGPCRRTGCPQFTWESFVYEVQRPVRKLRKGKATR